MTDASGIPSRARRPDDRYPTDREIMEFGREMLTVLDRAGVKPGGEFEVTSTVPLSAEETQAQLERLIADLSKMGVLRPANPDEKGAS